MHTELSCFRDIRVSGRTRRTEIWKLEVHLNGNTGDEATLDVWGTFSGEATTAAAAI
jgi:hypothetical protein